DLSGHTFVALPAQTDRPLYRRSLPYLRLPLFADFGEVVGEDVGGPAAVGTVDHDDRLIRKIYARINLGDGGIVPVADLAEKDVRQNIWRKLDFARYTRHVVSRHDRAQHSRNMQDFDFGLRQL